MLITKNDHYDCTNDSHIMIDNCSCTIGNIENGVIENRGLCQSIHIKDVKNTKISIDVFEYCTIDNAENCDIEIGTFGRGTFSNCRFCKLYILEYDGTPVDVHGCGYYAKEFTFSNMDYCDMGTIANFGEFTNVKHCEIDYQADILIINNAEYCDIQSDGGDEVKLNNVNYSKCRVDYQDIEIKNCEWSNFVGYAYIPVIDNCNNCHFDD